MAKILIVEDDRATGRLVATLARSMGHSTELATDGITALDVVRRDPPDLIISDVLMKPMGGLELLENVRKEFPQLPVVLFSAATDPEIHVRALRLGSIHFLSKPLRIDQLKRILDRAGGDRRFFSGEGATFELEAAPLSSSPFVAQGETLGENIEDALQPYFSGPSMQDLRSRIARIAKSRTRVLVDSREGMFNSEIIGLLHRMSPHAAGGLKVVNFVNEDAEALTEQWTNDAESWLQPVQRGSLFLLNIDALPAPAQKALAALVRLIQDTRIIATVRGDPDQLLTEGLLNESLYLRLSLFSIRISPLAEAGPALENMFIDAVCASSNYQAEARPVLGAAAREAIAAYAWPRNHMELRQVADYAAARFSGLHIGLNELPEVVAAARWNTLESHLENAAAVHIDRVMRTTSDITHAAASLGISEESLAIYLADRTLGYRRMFPRLGSDES